MPDKNNREKEEEKSQTKHTRSAVKEAPKEIVQPEPEQNQTQESGDISKREPEDKPSNRHYTRYLDKVLVWAHLKQKSWVVWLPVMLSVVILLITIFQSYVIQRQSDAMDKQVDLMAKQLEVQSVSERPYIYVKAAMMPNLAPNQPLQAVIIISNGGRTPAKDLNFTIEVAANANYVYFLGFPESNAPLAEVLFLAAGGEQSMGNAPADAVTLDNKFFEDVMNGKEYLIIHGKGRYRDFANVEFPFEEYCFAFSPEFKQFVTCQPDIYGASREKEQEK